MATDDALLEWARQQDDMIWIIRTYQWETPTLSFGVHQSEKSRQRSLAHYGQNRPKNQKPNENLPPKPKAKPKAWTQRPTGGRAILHGADISFSVITNDPWGIANDLTTSYNRLTHILTQALTTLQIPHTGSTEKEANAYTQSALCFETHTPHDIIGNNGHKMAGCAQVRRKNGVLQHGAVFFEETNPVQATKVTEENFLTALTHALEDTLIQDRQAVLKGTQRAEQVLISRPDYRDIAAPLLNRYSQELSGKVENA